MAPVRLKALHPLAGAVTGVSLGAAVALLVPGPLGPALGLLAAGAGLAASLRALERRNAEHRELLLAGLGEVKVRLATGAIRIDALSQRVELMPMRDVDAAPARAAINELTAEVGLLGDLIHQVATTLADHDEKLLRLPQAAPQMPASPLAAPAPAPEVRLDPEAARREHAEKLAAERAAAARAAREEAQAERAALIGAALSDGRVEVQLQPIVSLPQRRTRGYEALPGLRLDENTLLLPHEFLEIVDERGLGQTLDALVLTRALAIARHLAAKDGDVFITCNFSAATWASSRALAALTRILERYRDHIGRLVIEMPQAVFRSLDPTSLGLLGAMSANGVRFALDQVADLRLDPRSLFDRGIRFVKVRAALLGAHAEGRVASDIAAGDLAALLGRASIALVAEGVEDNPMAADMIELGVGMGQGNAFSPPRPVKPEVFAEPAPAAPARAEPPTARPTAEVLDYPQPSAPAAAEAQPKPERLPFRAVLRRASA
ncbi:EAL domain-containing protein [Bosea minatitlanensis]